MGGGSSAKLDVPDAKLRRGSRARVSHGDERRSGGPPSHTTVVDEFDAPPDQKLLAQIEELRRKLRDDPESAELRDDLLIAYCHPFFVGEPERVAQIVWLVKNRPQAPIMRSPCAGVDRERFPELHAQVEQAWAGALATGAERPEVARGAARFLFDTDPDRARKLLEDAAALHPNDAGLCIDLGGAAKTPAEKLRLFQRARSLGAKQSNLLRWLCDASIEAEEFTLASQYGNELLAESRAVASLPMPTYPGIRDARALVGDLLKPRGQRAYAKHHGHTTLGLVALRTGDTEAALSHLHASAEVDTDPRLSSYGPSFALARELCERGFHDDVLAYLNACKAFWKRTILEQWCTELSEGRLPTWE